MDRILCVCRRGNVRSVAVARSLKEDHGLCAIAVGFETCDAEAMRLLCGWARVIAVVREEFASRIPDEFANKVRVIDIGQDVWMNPHHPDLVKLVYREVPGFVQRIRAENRSDK